MGIRKGHIPSRSGGKRNLDKEAVHSPRVPDLDGPVARRGHDVLLVEVDDVDRGAMPHEHAA